MKSLWGQGPRYLRIKRDSIDVSPGFATNVVFGAVDEIVNSWLLAGAPGDLTRCHEPLMDLLSAGMVERREQHDRPHPARG